ncbi:MAG: holo-ACP synthase [Alphaproteobacteria bacterium]|nr:holo-ACP synthase [Alphaproteobacteria bacterium]
MIIGLGCDIVNLERLNKGAYFLKHFQNKILGAEEKNELALLPEKNEKELVCLLGKYYAGKEAFAKALGTGFRDGIFLKDIQIIHNKFGKPDLKISGNTLTYLQKIAPMANCLITLSDDYPFAQAVVVIENAES